MTALDKAIIKAYRTPASRDEAAAERVVTSTRTSRPIAHSAVPLSKALAELGQLPATVAPVGPAIANLLADAAHATADAVEEVGGDAVSLARAVVDPSSTTETNTSPRVAATANVVRAVLPVALAAAAPAAAPIVAGAFAAVQSAGPAIRAVEAAQSHSHQASTTLLERNVAAKLMTAMPTADSRAEQAEPVHTLPAPPADDANDVNIDNHADGNQNVKLVNTATAETAAATENSPQWHPMLQIDRIVWPSACGRLQGSAADALDQLVDNLRKIQNAGNKVIGMASCSDGEGVSTLLLAAARRMSNQGVSVAVIDANLARPTLATAVGLLPQLGWENALEGKVPLEDVVIESEFDHVAILPTIHALNEIPTAAVKSHLATLAQNFDSVLVDLGSLFTADGQWNEVASAIASFAGGTILVQNVRKTTPNRVADAQSHLERSGVSLVGLIQNFVVA